MLKLKIAAILALGAEICFAQDFSAESKQKMKEFEFLTGSWSGTGWVMTPEGKRDSEVLEDVSFEAGETVLVLKGKGYNTEGILVHDAVGVLYFDFMEKRYRIHSFISRGMNTVAEVDLLGPGKFSWWFTAGPSNVIKYTLTFENETWTEVGEMIDPEGNSRTFFSMALKRTE